MRFGNIQWFWAMLVVPVMIGLLWYTAYRRKHLASQFAEWSSWLTLTRQTWPAARRWKAVLLVVVLILTIFAVARPQWGARAVVLERRGLDIVLALDVSQSMLATDVRPNRLERAKREIGGIFDRLKGDRVGLVIFAGDAFVQCPLTLDAAAARLLLDAVDARSAGRPGTAIDEAIRVASDMYEGDEKKYKALILVTDGEGHEGDPLEAAKLAGEKGIRIYAVGVGTPAGEPIPVYDESGKEVGFKKDENGQVVLSKLDEVTLQKVALATNGRYFRAGPSGMELDELFSELDKLEKREMEGRLFTEFEERYHYFLIPAFLLLLLELILPETRKTLDVTVRRFREETPVSAKRTQ
ncbi:MAG: VWA domain-containing protein [Candidatus Zixiibacteriota bacterium]